MALVSHLIASFVLSALPDAGIEDYRNAKGAFRFVVSPAPPERKGALAVIHNVEVLEPEPITACRTDGTCFSLNAALAGIALVTLQSLTRRTRFTLRPWNSSERPHFLERPSRHRQANLQRLQDRILRRGNSRLVGHLPAFHAASSNAIIAGSSSSSCSPIAMPFTPITT